MKYTLVYIVELIGLKKKIVVIEISVTFPQ